jgi:hypothetical protein
MSGMGPFIVSVSVVLGFLAALWRYRTKHFDLLNFTFIALIFTGIGIFGALLGSDVSGKYFGLDNAYTGALVGTVLAGLVYTTLFEGIERFWRNWKRMVMPEVGYKAETEAAKAEAASVAAKAEVARVAAIADAAKAAAARAEAAKRKIFISYRRQIDAGHAGRIFDLLRGERAFDIFMDVDARRFGHDFVNLITEEVAKCDVLLAVIGRDWLDTRDEAGDRRLDDANDWVRLEIAVALKRQIPVIPVLMDGTKMPKANQLPPDLQQLPRRIAFELRNAYFRDDIDRLVHELKASS